MKAVFLDRDGVINVNRSSYVTSWEHFKFLPGALSAMRELSRLDCQVVVTTNQAAVGRGLMTTDTLEEIHRQMTAKVVAAGGRIDLILHCPHRPDDGCVCRKPKPGLFLAAADKFAVDLRSSYYIGDAMEDLGAAQCLRMRFVLVRSGRGAAQLAKNPRMRDQADFLAANLTDAARWILEREGPLIGRRLEKGIA